MVSQPVKAVILLFPISESLDIKRKKEDANFAMGGRDMVNLNVVWIKQSISNACGTIGILHALANQSDVTFVPESPLAKFIGDCKDKTPEERAGILETTPLFADIHAEAATSGQTTVPQELNTEYHFTCFVKAPDVSSRQDGTPASTMRLIELDGRRGGPMDRGECTDLLQDVAKIVKGFFVTQPSSMHFSMTALVSL